MTALWLSPFSVVASERLHSRAYDFHCSIGKRHGKLGRYILYREWPLEQMSKLLIYPNVIDIYAITFQCGKRIGNVVAKKYFKYSLRSENNYREPKDLDYFCRNENNQKCTFPQDSRSQSYNSNPHVCAAYCWINHSLPHRKERTWI